MADLSDLLLADLPTDAVELASIAPDGAPADGLTASPGLPWESSRRPDVEPGLSEFARGVTEEVLAEAERITAVAAALQHCSDGGLDLLKSFEGFSPVQYRDSVGVPTIGYGTTSAVVFPLPSRCTRAQATGWLRLYVQRNVEPAIRATGAHLNQHQFDALCSLGYNLGAGCFSSAWTIGRDLRAHNLGAAANAILLYDRAGGAVLPGLVRRRQDEHRLFVEKMPPAPDPHHLLWFPDHTWTIDGKRIPERGTLAEWYRLLAHKAQSERRLHELQAELVLLRKRDWAVAHSTHPPKWSSDHLGGRWQILDHETAVKL